METVSFDKKINDLRGGRPGEPKYTSTSLYSRRDGFLDSDRSGRGKTLNFGVSTSNKRADPSMNRRTVFFEMVGEDRFAVSLHGFFSHELKDAIKQIEHAKFDMVNKVWILPNSQKGLVIESVRKVCNEMDIQIVDVPLWVKEYYQNPLPFSLTYNLKGIDREFRHDFRKEAQSFYQYR